MRVRLRNLCSLTCKRDSNTPSVAAAYTDTPAAPNRGRAAQSVRPFPSYRADELGACQKRQATVGRPGSARPTPRD